MEKVTSIESSDASMMEMKNITSSNEAIAEINNMKTSNALAEKIHKMESSTRVLDKGLEFVALLSLIVSVSLAVFGVFMRYFFGVSYGMIEEICRYSIIYGVFAYIGPLIKKNEHIKMDLMDNLLKGKARIVNDLMISFILFFAYAFLCWTGFQWVSSLFQMKLMTSSGTMLMAIPTIAVPIGMFFGCVYAFQQIILIIYKMRLSNS